MQKSRFIFLEEMLNLSKIQSFPPMGHCHPCEKSREPDVDLWRVNCACQAEGEAFWLECWLQRRSRVPESVQLWVLWSWGRGDALVAMSVGRESTQEHQQI